MIRLGVIGCGGMAGEHTPALLQLNGRVEVVATADPVLDRAQATASALGARLTTTDYREILDDVDAVLVAVPHHLHHAVGRACIDAGKHVLMEKPLAVTEAECLDLIEAATRQDVVLLVGYVLRYHPLAVKLAELIHDRTYGEVFHVSMWTEQFSKFDPDHWYCREETSGGGQLFSHGCHYIDLLLWYLGEAEMGTHLGTNLGTPWMEREGTSDVTLKFRSGALGYHGATWGAAGSRLRYSFQAQATDGMMELDFPTGRLLLHRWTDETVLLDVGVGSKLVHHELVHFLDCIERGATPFTDGRSSLEALRVIWRLYAAERDGSVADLRGLGLATDGRPLHAAIDS